MTHKWPVLKADLSTSLRGGAGDAWTLDGGSPQALPDGPLTDNPCGRGVTRSCEVNPRLWMSLVLTRLCRTGDQAGGCCRWRGLRAGMWGEDCCWGSASLTLPTSCPALHLGSWVREPLAYMVEPLSLSPCVLSGKHLRSLQQVLRHQLHKLQERLPHLGPRPLLPPVPRKCSRWPPLRGGLWVPGRWVAGTGVLWGC